MNMWQCMQQNIADEAGWQIRQMMLAGWQIRHMMFAGRQMRQMMRQVGR